MTNVEISSLIFELVRNNLYASSSDILMRALRNRFVGFRAELHFRELMSKKQQEDKRELYNGGFFLPLRDKAPTLASPIYFTTDHRNEIEYKDVYSLLNKMSLAKLYYIKYDSKISIDNWEKVSLFAGVQDFPIPKFSLFDFQNGAFKEVSSLSPSLDQLLSLFTSKVSAKQENKVDDSLKHSLVSLLEPFSASDLIDLYVTRLVFDGIIDMKYYKGLPSDIDLIAFTKGQYIFYEIKEKDLSKTSPIGFGIDIQRLEDCLYIEQQLGIRYLYFVRQINDQTKREFVNWRYIDFLEFEKHSNKSNPKNGGAGMNTLSFENPTVLVLDAHFNTID